MKILLEQHEIEQALIQYIGQQGLPIAGNHIKVTLVADKELTAAIEITGKPSLVSNTGPIVRAAVADPEETEPSEEPDPDRDALKAELDKLGIEYPPKTRTSTLVTLLEEAKAAASAEEKCVDCTTSNVFGETVGALGETVGAYGVTVKEDAPSDEDTPIFGQNAEPPAQPKKEAPPFDVPGTEAPDDDTPLFGA